MFRLATVGPVALVEVRGERVDGGLGGLEGGFEFGHERFRRGNLGFELRDRCEARDRCDDAGELAALRVREIEPGRALAILETRQFLPEQIHRVVELGFARDRVVLFAHRSQ